ncbi:MAG: hypothetical protein K1X64_01975 [Myxococcaceae bacterium]|nr:hypothetical protein [Myxococcaceae bacterium]
MSFFSGLLGSVGSSLVNSALGSLTSSLFDAGSSLFSSIGSGISGLFSDKGGSVDHNSLFPDVFESKDSVVPSLSVASPSVDVHGAGDASFNATDRFASSFDFNNDAAPVKISSALDSLPSISSDAPSVQLRQPVTDSSQFDRLFPSAYDDLRPKQAELELKQTPGFMSPEELLRASQADSFSTTRPDDLRRFGTDNFLSDDERRAALYGGIRMPGANDAWRDRTVDTVNGEAVVRKSPSENAFDLATMAVPFGLGRAGKAAVTAEAVTADFGAIRAAAQSIRGDEALFERMIASAAESGGKAPAHSGLAFTTVPDSALESIMKNNLVAGRALGREAGENANSIWFSRGNPFYGEGTTLVIPVERLMELGGVESYGVAGQSGVMRVPFEALPGGIPFSEFAVVESIGKGYVQELWRPSTWKGGIGPLLPR